jgi:hypothetical protein
MRRETRASARSRQHAGRSDAATCLGEVHRGFVPARADVRRATRAVHPVPLAGHRPPGRRVARGARLIFPDDLMWNPRRADGCHIRAPAAVFPGRLLRIRLLDIPGEPTRCARPDEQAPTARSPAGQGAARGSARCGESLRGLRRGGRTGSRARWRGCRDVRGPWARGRPIYQQDGDDGCGRSHRHRKPRDPPVSSAHSWPWRPQRPCGRALIDALTPPLRNLSRVGPSSCGTSSPRRRSGLSSFILFQHPRRRSLIAVRLLPPAPASGSCRGLRARLTRERTVATWV